MRHLYNSRCEVLRLTVDMQNGLALQSWQKLDVIIDYYLAVPGELMCRLDLIFQRPGKDQPMPLVAGRAPDRVGLLMFDPTDEIRSGDRFHVLQGPVQGTFEIRVMPDPAQAFGMLAHHMEVQVIEVAQNFQPNLLDADLGP
jgi:hypothetical protein